MVRSQPRKLKALKCNYVARIVCPWCAGDSFKNVPLIRPRLSLTAGQLRLQLRHRMRHCPCQPHAVVAQVDCWDQTWCGVVVVCPGWCTCNVRVRHAKSCNFGTDCVFHHFCTCCLGSGSYFSHASWSQERPRGGLPSPLQEIAAAEGMNVRTRIGGSSAGCRVLPGGCSGTSGPLREGDRGSPSQFC
jgi:hypothetical protein